MSQTLEIILDRRGRVFETLHLAFRQLAQTKVTMQSKTLRIFLNKTQHRFQVAPCAKGPSFSQARRIKPAGQHPDRLLRLSQVVEQIKIKNGLALKDGRKEFFMRERLKSITPPVGILG